jgi:lipid-A-disaccharide synthase
MSLTDRAAAARAPTTGRIGRGGSAGGRDDLRIFVVAGEHSGDALGGKLMSALSARCKGRIHYLGVGGEQMEEAGLASQFPLSDVAVMGPLSILPRLPRLISRVHRTVDAAVAAEPDAVVIIDAPEFTHPIAKRIRKKAPSIPIIDYVSPSVWAWRPGRARKMRPYVDRVMGLLPFEPAAHQRLGGPPCTYVGHPLIERLEWLHGLDTAPLADKLQLDPGRLTLLVLPGSRTSEVSHLMQPFGETLELLQQRHVRPQVIIPAVPHVRPLIEKHLQSWSVKPHFVEGEEDKFRAFRLAHAALAASGTVTLELALAGTPMVVAYKVDAIAAQLRFLLKVQSVVLANLVLEENAFPELLQEECTPQNLADALEQLLKDTPVRRAQMNALARIPHKMLIDGPSPSDLAADIVLDFAVNGRRDLPVGR